MILSMNIHLTVFLSINIYISIYVSIYLSNLAICLLGQLFFWSNRLVSGQPCANLFWMADGICFSPQTCGMQTWGEKWNNLQTSRHKGDHVFSLYKCTLWSTNSHPYGESQCLMENTHYFYGHGFSGKLLVIARGYRFLCSPLKGSPNFKPSQKLHEVFHLHGR